MSRVLNRMPARGAAVATATATALLALALMYVPLAPAASVPLGAGETKIAFSSGFLKTLRQQGIAIKPLGSAALKGRKLTLSISSGAFDSGVPEATFAHGGGFKIAGSGKGIALKKLKLDPATKSLSAVAAGKRIRFASLGGAELEREGFDAHLGVKRLRLSGAGARALNRLVGSRVFSPGRMLGSAETLAEPSEVEPRFGTISIGGPNTTLTKLQELKIDMGVWGSTEVAGEGIARTFMFPIQPPRLAADASAGVVESEANNGLTMQRYEPSGRDLLLRNPRVDLATGELFATLSPLSTEGPVTGTIGTLDFDGAKVQFRYRIGAIEMSGIRAISTQFMADQLNERLSPPGAMQAGETLAWMSIDLHAG